MSMEVVLYANGVCYTEKNITSSVMLDISTGLAVQQLHIMLPVNQPTHQPSACLVIILQFFLLFWHASLGVRSAKRRHQSPEQTILSHANCFIRERLLDFRSCWIVFIQVVRGHPDNRPTIDIGRLSAVLPIIGIGLLLCWYRPIVIDYVL